MLTQVTWAQSPLPTPVRPAKAVRGPRVVQVPTTTINPQLAAAMQEAAAEKLVAQAEFDPPVIAQGQHTTYRLVVTAPPEGTVVPDPLPVPKGWRAQYTGRAYSLHPVAGGLPQLRTTMNFRVTPDKVGTQRMPAYTLNANGEDIPVAPCSLTVLPAGTRLPLRSPRLVVQVPTNTFYIGQAVPVQVELLDPTVGHVRAVGRIQVAGDSILTETTFGRYQRQVRHVEGQTVMAHVNEIIITPIKAGRDTFQVQELASVSPQASTNGITLPGYMPLYDADPVTIQVGHLPSKGVLPGFTGGIGTFRLLPPRLSARRVPAGTPITLTVTVVGEGNLSHLLPPDPVKATGWQMFRAAPDSAPPMEVLLRHAVQFTYTLIPLSPQVTATPAIPFSYFDPHNNRYVDLTIPPVAIHVLPARNEPAIADTVLGPTDQGGETNQPSPAPVMTGLIKTPGWQFTSLAPVQTRAWFLVLQLLPALLLGGLWSWSHRRRYLAAHPEVVARSRARRALRHQLRQLRRATAARDAPRFVTAAVAALRAASAPRAAANPGALVCADVLRALPTNKAQNGGAELVRTLFAAADAAHFVDRQLATEAILARQTEIEQLLRQWRDRL